MEKRLSLGAYPVVSLKDAGKRRDNAKRLLASGTTHQSSGRRRGPQRSFGLATISFFDTDTDTDPNDVKG
jgi:hypothetical protein